MRIGEKPRGRVRRVLGVIFRYGKIEVCRTTRLKGSAVATQESYIIMTAADSPSAC
jgi:hypothetical protein